MAHHPDDNSNLSNNPHFQDVLAKAATTGLTRRSLIRGGLGLAAVGSLPMLSACGGSDDTPAGPTQRPLGFTAIDKSLLDNVILPAGYSYTVLHATGDRLVSTIPAYTNQGTEADDWSQRIGDHHDGMDLFYVGANGRYSTTATDRAVLVVNHESSADAHFFHPRGQTSNGVNGKKFSQFGEYDLGTRPADEVLKEINHHGVSIVELSRNSTGR